MGERTWPKGRATAYQLHANDFLLQTRARSIVLLCCGPGF